MIFKRLQNEFKRQSYVSLYILTILYLRSPPLRLRTSCHGRQKRSSSSRLHGVRRRAGHLQRIPTYYVLQLLGIRRILPQSAERHFRIGSDHCLRRRPARRNCGANRQQQHHRAQPTADYNDHHKQQLRFRVNTNQRIMHFRTTSIPPKLNVIFKYLYLFLSLSIQM